MLESSKAAAKITEFVCGTSEILTAKHNLCFKSINCSGMNSSVICIKI